MSKADADRNLLFGILALQMDFVTRDALIAAMNAWVLEKSRPLGEVLVGLGALSASRRDLLEGLVREHLGQHGDDPQRSLAALGSTTTVREALGQVDDAEVHASLALVPDDPFATRTYVAAPPASAAARFTVLRPHARGALGQVSVALDRELDRQVALKEIQGRHADDPASRDRFLLEAEVTGKLEHPGVVPVYGLGSYPDGRPYYAMRLIRGDTLREAIARFHKAEGPGRDPGERALQLRELLGRFLDVCNAMAYAHSRGVLHRDLKPSNVMLGPYGETLVVDWGLAWPTGRVDPTAGEAEEPLRTSSGSGSYPEAEGSAVGTPHYMSPEQAEGRLDRLGPRSDVYGLGATLYHLLAGRAPIEDADPTAALRKAQRGDFPPPRQVRPEIPEALAAICAKAMALRPEDRYPSPKALADDLKRWLADEPVSAYRDPWTRRAARWARRHRGGVQAGAALTAVALVAAVATAIVREARGRERAEHFRAEAERSRAEAEHRTVVRFARVALQTVASTVQSADELKRIAGTQSATVGKVLEIAARNYETLLDQAGPSADLLDGKARMLNAFSEVYLQSGDTDRALAHAREAEAIYRQLLGREPGEGRWRGGLGTSLEKAGLALALQGKPSEAVGAFRASLDAREPLARREPANPQWQADLAGSLGLIGATLEEQGDRPGGADYHRRALAIREALVARDPENPKWRDRLASSTEKMAGVLYYVREDMKGSLALYEKAMGLYKDLADREPDNADWQRHLARLTIAVGQMYQELGDTPRALDHIRRSLAIAERFAALDPNHAEWRRQVFECRFTLSNLQKTKDLAAALREQLATLRGFEPIIAAQRKKSPHYAQWQRLEIAIPWLIGQTLVSLARLGDSRAENLDRAMESLRRALALREQARPDPTDYQAALSRGNIERAIGAALEARGDAAGAREHKLKSFRPLLDFYKRQADREPTNPVWREGLARQWLMLGNSQAVEADYRAARESAGQALRIYQGLAGREPDRAQWQKGLADTHAFFALLAVGQQDWKGEAAALREAIAVRERLAEREPKDPARWRELAEGYQKIVSTLRIVGDRPGAEAAFQKRLDALDRLQALDPDEASGDLLKPESNYLLFKESRTRGAPLDAARGIVANAEALYRIDPAPSRAAEVVDACLNLAQRLDTSPTGGDGIPEARRALGRARAVLRGLQGRGQLHKVQQSLLARIEAALAKLPAAPAPIGLDGPAREALDDLDYRRLAELLVGEKRTRELLAVLDAEAVAAARMTWLAGHLAEIAAEPKVAAEIVAAAKGATRSLAPDESLGPEGRRLVATLARTVGDRDAARELDPRVLEAPPDVTRALTISRRLSVAGRHREAARVLQEVAETVPGPGQVPNLQSLAVAQLSSAQAGPAERTVRKALDLAPEDATNRALLGWALYQQRRFAPARDEARAALAGPTKPTEWARRLATTVLAGIALEAGDLDAMESEARALQSAFGPDDAGAQYLSTYLAAERGRDLDRAEATARGLLKAQPAEPTYQALLGWVLARRDRGAEALPLLERASGSELGALDPVLFDHLGDTHRRLGQPGRARDAWRKALALFPDTADAADRRRREIEAKLRALDGQ
jgi:eukaryotic-like serine/threonine-protein kinase